MDATTFRQQRVRTLAWTAVAGMVLWLLALAAFGFWHSPALQENLLGCILHRVLVGVFSPHSMLYMAWIMVGVVAGARGRWKVKPWYVLAMLLPAIVAGGFVLWRLVTDPPSPETYFRRFFLADLPADARNLQVRESATPDVGTVAYYFHCDPSSTRRLIEEMKVKEVAWADIGEDHLVDVPHWYFRRPAVVPDPAEWIDRHQYVWRDGRTGTEHYIITNQSMTEVFVSRNPLASKTDDELGPEAAAALRGEDEK